MLSSCPIPHDMLHLGKAYQCQADAAFHELQSPFLSLYTASKHVVGCAGVDGTGRGRAGQGVFWPHHLASHRQGLRGPGSHLSGGLLPGGAHLPEAGRPGPEVQGAPGHDGAEGLPGTAEAGADGQGPEATRAGTGHPPTAPVPYLLRHPGSQPLQQSGSRYRSGCKGMSVGQAQVHPCTSPLQQAGTKDWVQVKAQVKAHMGISVYACANLCMHVCAYLQPIFASRRDVKAGTGLGAYRHVCMCMHRLIPQQQSPAAIRNQLQIKCMPLHGCVSYLQPLQQRFWHFPFRELEPVGVRAATLLNHPHVCMLMYMFMLHVSVCVRVHRLSPSAFVACKAAARPKPHAVMLLHLRPLDSAPGSHASQAKVLSSMRLHLCIGLSCNRKV